VNEKEMREKEKGKERKREKQRETERVAGLYPPLILDSE
jgi:hypothetical protein